MNRHLLNINILDHPTNQLKIVFFYTEVTHSDYFKSLLKEANISYEFEIDESNGQLYFGIDKRHSKKAKYLNYLVFARFRKPFISNVLGKYLLVLTTLLFIILAIIGYMLKN